MKAFVTSLAILLLAQAARAEDIQMKLPAPRLESAVSIEAALHRRRSIRAYADAPLGLADLAQLLWAAQGVTAANGFRTAPSAGALYPLEVYVFAGNVVDLPAGIYKYHPQGHTLSRIVEGDRRRELMHVALEQSSLRDAAAVILIAAVYERTTAKYGTRGLRYVHMEAGHAAQNVYLQAVSLNLGTVAIGAFDDTGVKRVAHLSEHEQPLYLLPIGRE
jgi:SagB-type dehydrogenase family enzyme